MRATHYRKATINREGDPDRGRLPLALIRDGGVYRWIDADTGDDSEVSADSIDAAVDAAYDAWGGGPWDIEVAGKPDC